jgi:archaellum component FlaD/FlaE
MEVTLATLAVSVSLEFLPEVTNVGTFGIAGGLAAGTVPAVLGIMDFLGGDDDTDEEDDSVFDDGGDDMGGLDELDDDGLDGFDDDGLDGFEDDSDTLGGGGGNTDELENRLDELENEVATLSSTVNTVQSENEAVSETVDEIEENVRDLLEIYEMVTRGVNPFVDDTASGAMGGDAGGTFGLFDDDDGNTGGEVDDSIADADAEEFFEDDFDDPGGEEFADPDDAAIIDDGDGMSDDEEFFEDDLEGTDDDGFGAGGGMPDDGGMDNDDGETGGDDGKSFEELKQEYESGDPGWDVEDPAGEEESDDPDDGPMLEDSDDGLEADDGLDGEPGLDSEPPEAEFEAGSDDGEMGLDVDSDDEKAGVEDRSGDGEEFEFVGEQEKNTGSGDGGRLHLREFPDGYRADVTALEWMEYLLGVGGPDGARNALSYYVDIGWISPSVEDDLLAFLDGIHVSDADREASGGGGFAAFDPGDHRKSLAYVARLAGDSDRAEVDHPDGSVMDSMGAHEGTESPAADGGSKLYAADDSDSAEGEYDGI